MPFSQLKTVKTLTLTTCLFTSKIIIVSMKKMCLVWVLCLAFAIQNYAQRQPKAIQQFAATFEGIYSSKRFSDTTKLKFFLEQEVIIMPIFKEAPDKWFYFGWYPPKTRDQVLEEVFVRVFLKEDSLKLYFYTIPKAFSAQQPWAQANPYSQCNYNDLIDEGDNGQCNITMLGKSNYKIEAYKYVEQKNATVARFKYIKYAAAFDGKSSISSTQFLTEEGQVVLDHKGIFYFDRVSKKFKEFGDIE